jgi:hypothetical protein
MLHSFILLGILLESDARRHVLEALPAQPETVSPDHAALPSASPAANLSTKEFFWFHSNTPCNF